MSENIDLELFNDASDIGRLNDLLDKLTEKRFTSASLASSTVRAALDLYGIRLPILDIDGYSRDTMFEGRAVQLGATTANCEISAPPVEGEYLFNISGKEADDEIDEDNDIYLYFVVSLDDFLYDAYAQIVTKEEADSVMGHEFDEKDFPEVVGDIAGETTWDKMQRHNGNYDNGEA